MANPNPNWNTNTSTSGYGTTPVATNAYGYGYDTNYMPDYSQANAYNTTAYGYGYTPGENYRSIFDISFSNFTNCSS
jgi:hypothetical protein